MDDSENAQPGFQQAVIAAGEKVTHIAPADDNGETIGSSVVVARGVIQYPLKQLGLYASITSAPRTTREQCNTAQSVAVCAAIDYALAHR
ncbi:hypothetical protein [Microbulbifer yueqingensis]|uniref:hypothetical protein n=1 Tax=Microbulbifer yueqingensis TaxID=658219 RepID=UPI000AF094B5|nr:hypothetical protein [Microbulbifer yueqingensis]